LTDFQRNKGGLVARAMRARARALAGRELPRPGAEIVAAAIDAQARRIALRKVARANKVLSREERRQEAARLAQEYVENGGTIERVRIAWATGSIATPLTDHIREAD
jgi:hypothetical protein